MGFRSIKINTTSWFIKSFLNALRKCQKSDPLTEKSQRIVAAYGITRPFQNHHKSPQKTNGAPCDKISSDSFASTRHIWDKWIPLSIPNCQFTKFQVVKLQNTPVSKSFQITYLFWIYKSGFKTTSPWVLVHWCCELCDIPAGLWALWKQTNKQTNHTHRAGSKFTVIYILVWANESLFTFHYWKKTALGAKVHLIKVLFFLISSVLSHFI